jgi:hypothetical protein
VANRINNPDEILSKSWAIVSSDRSILILPFLGWISAVAAFAVAAGVLRLLHQPGLTDLGAAFLHRRPLPFICYFGAYLGAAFSLTFFNSALISIVLRRTRSEPASIHIGLTDARDRMLLILQWSLFMATIGVVMRFIERRTWNIGGFLLARVLEIAFSVVGFLAMPVLVAENKSPIAAFRESARLLRKTWGTQIVGSIYLGTLFGVLYMFAVLAVGVGFVFFFQERGELPLFVGGIILILVGSAAGMVLISLDGATRAVFQTALYLYGRDGVVIGGFTDQLLNRSLRPDSPARL